MWAVKLVGLHVIVADWPRPWHLGDIIRFSMCLDLVKFPEKGCWSAVFSPGVRTGKGHCFEWRKFWTLLFSFHSVSPSFPFWAQLYFQQRWRCERSSLPLLTSLVSFIAQEVGGVDGMRIGLGTHAWTHVCTHMHPCMYTHLLRPCLDFVKIRKRTLHFWESNSLEFPYGWHWPLTATRK